MVDRGQGTVELKQKKQTNKQTNKQADKKDTNHIINECYLVLLEKVSKW